MYEYSAPQIKHFLVHLEEQLQLLMKYVSQQLTKLGKHTSTSI